MIIEFSVTNYRSFRQTQTLSLAANPSTDLLEENTFSTSMPGLPRLLRSVVIYGPNAAGKSNLIQAVNAMKDFVLSSAKETQKGETIPVIPFLLDSETQSEPSEFEALFIQDGVRFQYGFAANSKRIMDEWLWAYPNVRGQKWFERHYDPESGKYIWYFGPKFTGHRKVWQDATRSNALFLSTAIQLNNEQLKPVFEWFQKLAVLGHGSVLSPGFTTRQCEQENKKKEILRLLKSADLSIKDIILKQKEFSLENLPDTDGVPESVRVEIKKELVGKKMTIVNLAHSTGKQDGPVPIPLGEESGGTQKLFAYAGPWLDVLASGRILLVDELDNSFHPLMMQHLIKLINNPSINRHNAQLVFTTHNTSLLDREFLRRDQVWFVEKDEQNATLLYPLSDFSPRKGEALEKGYLHGRYGALPYIGELRV